MISLCYVSTLYLCLCVSILIYFLLEMETKNVILRIDIYFFLQGSMLRSYFES